MWAVLEGHGDAITSLDFSKDGRYIISNSSSGEEAGIWDLETSKVKHPCVAGERKRAHSIAFSPEGRYIASASWDESIRIWDVLTGEMVSRLEDIAAVYCVAFTPDGRALISGGADRTVKRWDLSSSSPRLDTASDSCLRRPRCYSGHIAPIYTVAVAASSFGEWIISTSGVGEIRFWDANTGDILLAFKPDMCDGGCPAVSSSPAQTLDIRSTVY